MKPCSTPGCNKPVKAKNVCSACYNRQWRLAHPEADGKRIRKPQQPCTFPECGRPRYAAGICAGHYMQQRRGHTLVPIGTMRRGPAPGTKRKPRGEPRKRRSKLPAGWENTARKPKKQLGDKSAMRVELGTILPTDPALIASCRDLLARHDALDLAEALGVTS